MARIQTPITGITTTSDYQEGNTLSLVNLRPKNGALHPVAPRKTIKSLSDKYDIVFVHQNSGYKNWIGVKNEYGYSQIYSDIDKAPRFIASASTTIAAIEQIGNTLSVITEDEILYILYKDGSYQMLGEIPDIPRISVEPYYEWMYERYFKTEYPGGTRPSDFINHTKGLVYKIMDLLVEGGTQNNGVPISAVGPLLFDAHMIRWAFRLYDGSLTKYSPPILLMPASSIIGTTDERGNKDNLHSLKTIAYDFDDTIRHDDSRVIVKGFRVAMTYDFTFKYQWRDWEDIIKSVDIFLSPALGISNIENMRKDLPTYDMSKTEYYELITEIPPSAFESIENSGNYYLIKSVNLGSEAAFYNPDIFPISSQDKYLVKNLLQQEAMGTGDFSSHKIGAKTSYTYNNRLHIAGIKTTFFKGFNTSYFQWDNRYNGVSPSSDKVGSTDIEVEIEVGAGKIEKVVVEYYEYFNFPKPFMSAFISYPDPRAIRMNLYEYKDGVYKKTLSVPLKKHGALNIAYYLEKNLKPIQGDAGVVAQPSSGYSKVQDTEPNKIKVSELNNPIVFPNKNTYQAGNGEVIAMASNATRISEGQFGQYPLYIFTTQGIYALNVGEGEVVYSNLSAPVSYEIPISPIICSTPFGVIFVSKRGICIIRGQEVELLTANIQQPIKKISLQQEQILQGVLLDYIHSDFLDYLKNINRLVYDPKENELIVRNDNFNYNYVLNLDSQSFYQSTEKIDNVVMNTFPELYIIEGNNIKDYSDSQHPRAHVSLITRPILFGTSGVKRLERMILRATLISIDNAGQGRPIILNYFSNDGVNFPILRGIPLKPGSYKDLDMGLFARSKYKEFIFALAGTLDEQAEIYHLDTEVESEYNNTKMR